MRLSTRVSVAPTVLLLMTVGIQPAFGQSSLPLGTVAKGTTSDSAPTEYALKAESAGVLVVTVQGSGDLVIEVLDADGQTVTDGTADRDLNGDAGRELLSVVLPEEGDYRVRVRVQMGGSTSDYQIGASWLAFPPFQGPPDADGRARQARSIEIGASIVDSLDSAAGDSRDWYVLTATTSGTLVVVTRPGDGEEGDLALEAFLDSGFGQPAARSDQDLQGSSASESVSVNVQAGQTVHIKVAGAFGSVRAAYRLSSSLMP